MRIAIAFWLAILLTACAHKGHFKTANADPCMEKNGSCTDAALVSTKEKYILSFVEIDEQGILEDRQQAQNILKIVRGQKNQYVIVYIHGWHNDASSGKNADVDAFRRRLNFAKSRYPEKNVVGIYIGWRGDSITIPYLNIITFWDRKNVSEEIGRNALLEFLLELESIKRVKGDANVLLLSGHSFGASALYNATHQTLLQRLVQTKEKQHVQGFGDLVVLVNPANESMLYAPLYDASQTRASSFGYEEDQPTVFIAAGSQADFPAKTLFPVGRTFSTLFESHRTYTSPARAQGGNGPEMNQGQMDRYSLTHYNKHVTHRLTAQGQAGADQICPYEKGWKAKAVNRAKEEQRLENKPVTGEGWTTGNRAMGPEYRPLLGGKSELELTHIEQSHTYSPYWVIQVDHTIFPGHNDINQKHFWCLMDLVIQEGGGEFSAPLAPPRVEGSAATL